MSTSRTVSEFRDIDKNLDRTLKILTPVSHGMDAQGKEQVSWMSYQGIQPAPLMEKMDYAAVFGADPKPVVNVTEEDVTRLKDIAMMGRIGRFNNWVGSQFRPYENPASRELLKKLYPEWFDAQRQMIEDYHDLKKRVETLQVIGPQNKEDLYLYWKLKGEVDSDLKRKLETIPGMRTKTNDDNSTVNFRRGLFSRHEQWEMATDLSKQGVAIGNVPAETEVGNPLAGLKFG